MPHQMGICKKCGKKRHWPRNAQVGDEWRCFDCGTITILVDPGTPKASHTETVRSKPGAPSVASTSRASNSATRASSPGKYSPVTNTRPGAQQASGGCALIFALGALLWTLGALVY